MNNYLLLRELAIAISEGKNDSKGLGIAAWNAFIDLLLEMGYTHIVKQHHPRCSISYQHRRGCYLVTHALTRSAYVYQAYLEDEEKEWIITKNSGC